MCSRNCQVVSVISLVQVGDESRRLSSADTEVGRSPEANQACVFIAQNAASISLMWTLMWNIPIAGNIERMYERMYRGSSRMQRRRRRPLQRTRERGGGLNIQTARVWWSSDRSSDLVCDSEVQPPCSPLAGHCSLRGEMDPPLAASLQPT